MTRVTPQQQRPATLPAARRPASPANRGTARVAGGSTAWPASAAAGAGASASLTSSGAAVFVTVPTLLGGLVDIALSQSLGWTFAVAFVVSSGYVAARVRRSHLLAALVTPPLAFTAVTVLLMQILPAAGGGGFVLRQVLGLATALAFGAPVLWTGSLLAAGIAAWRRLPWSAR